jgi:hypothetical protein
MRTSTRNINENRGDCTAKEKYSFSSSMKCQKKIWRFFLFQTISKTISYLSQGREGGLVIDVDESSTILTTTSTSPWSSATSTRATTPVPTIPSTATVATASSATTAFWSFETGVDFKVDLFLFFGTSLGSGLGLWY